jgi:hypothetical protein
MTAELWQNHVSVPSEQAYSFSFDAKHYSDSNPD